ncbi:2'-deoxynucleoside 5'-phosphate N-hydrolase 1 [Desmophyllum pertusum]|uniref:Putative 2'-deoxynucleoside 5'-phosphate N-hydrolase 1 n=1 Tax=Desmophyllum pertusum TaxID=174260 RepID=A0A9X0DAH0_9CNID|nr:2'-deoxynucleoside 5'-phosphate N-hydrolase 1 [Desmophyllum pertusum]
MASARLVSNPSRRWRRNAWHVLQSELENERADKTIHLLLRKYSWRKRDAALYKRIIDQLKQYGDVLTEHIADADILDKDQGSDKFIHDRDMAWLMKSDALVAEVTQPSLGVGYEIGRAIENNKRILCLFRPDSGKYLSAMIGGAIGEHLQVKNYKEDDVPGILKEFFDSL